MGRWPRCSDWGRGKGAGVNPARQFHPWRAQPGHLQCHWVEQQCGSLVKGGGNSSRPKPKQTFCQNGELCPFQQQRSAQSFHHNPWIQCGRAGRGDHSQLDRASPQRVGRILQESNNPVIAVKTVINLTQNMVSNNPFLHQSTSLNQSSDKDIVALSRGVFLKGICTFFQTIFDKQTTTPRTSYQGSLT